MIKEFKISVVMPIYNVENYLEEAIDSVINQTIGFEENIQLILVNDGSPDDSETICLKYKNLYPDNIVYIKQENAGVSAARNRGKEEVTGKYLNFFDSDDIWDLESYQILYDFIEKNSAEIDIVSCRLEFFGNKNHSHPLNFKYEEDRIIDIHEDFDFIQLSASSALIKTEVIKNKNFDTTIAYSEDALLLTQLLIEKCKYGVVSDAVYYYRRREEENSAIQQSSYSLEWYFDTPKKSYRYLMDLSKEKYGEVLKYIQSYVMYDLQWRLKTPFPDIFSEETKKEYVELLSNLLKDIDDDIIFTQKNITSEYKFYAMELKYGHPVTDEITLNKNSLYYKDHRIHTLTYKALFRINILNVVGNKLSIQGQLRTILDDDKFIVYAQDTKDNIYPIKLERNKLSSIYGIDRELLYASSFSVEIPVDEPTDIKMFIKYKDYEPVKLKYTFLQHSKLSSRFKLSYFKDKKIIFNAGHSIIRVVDRTPLKELRSRLRTSWDLLKHKKIKVVILRVIVAMSSPFIKKPIWLVSDRLSYANDNGYHFFKYINENKKDEVNSYFVLDKNSEDYLKMKSIGKVVSFDSLKYKILFLLSDKIISSSGEDWVINPFKGAREMYKNLYTFDFVFLQHGIIKNDLSSWLHKLSKNIRMFVTSASREYDSIIDGDYGYSAREVKLVGLPRYDNLIDNRQKKIVIMPTWRKNLVAADSKDVPGDREYSETFKNSDYFKFYNDLINHERLIQCFKKYGYTGEFVIHPSHLRQDRDFITNSVFSVNSGYADYQKYFNECSLLVTDYSSVSMDFAYLNKPVVYAQFDRESFYNGQVYTAGYFDDERDGFGPVYTDLESTVDGIINQIENDCKQDEKYENRIKNFYAFHDKKNCFRVYNEIKKI